MRCEYCGREGCPARAGTYFDSADDAARALHDCRAATRDRASRAEAELSEWRARTGCQSPDRYVEASGLRTVAQLVERIGQLGRAEAEASAMQAEAEKWARVGWRDLPEQDAAIAAGCNRAAEAILVAKENNR